MSPIITFNVDWVMVLTFITGTAVPLLVALVTTRETSPTRKALVLIGLSFIGSVLNEILDATIAGEPYDLGSGLFRWGTIAVVAIASYFGVWSRPNAAGESVASRVIEHGRKPS